MLRKKNDYNIVNDIVTYATLIYRNAYDNPPPSSVPMAHKTGIGNELFVLVVSGKNDPKRINPIIFSFA